MQLDTISIAFSAHSNVHSFCLFFLNVSKALKLSTRFIQTDFLIWRHRSIDERRVDVRGQKDMTKEKDREGGGEAAETRKVR